MTRFAITEEPAGSPDVRRCFARYYAELGALFGYQPDEALPLEVEDLTRPHGLVLLVREGEVGPAVGCGALKLLEGGIGEIKRMWIDRRMRGQGLGGRLLDELEAVAYAEGCQVIRLDSNGRLDVAIALYRARGYKEVAPFNAEPFATHWMEKRLR
jgi:GNAT superfamily N-acetyltransferase